MKNEVNDKIEKVKKQKQKILGFLMTCLVIVAVLSINSDPDSVMYVVLNVLILMLIGVSLVTLMIFTSILQKHHMTEIVTYVVSIFHEAVDDQDEYRFPISQTETNVFMTSNGFEINDIHYDYDQYDMSLSATAYRHVFDLSIEMFKKEMNDEKRDVQMHEAFTLKLTPELYHAILQFGLVLDDDSRKRLEILKHDPEDAVKRIMRRGFLKIN